MAKPKANAHTWATETDKLLTLILVATRTAAAASIASGMIAASGRPHSIGEALSLLEDIQFTLYPKPRLAGYQEWAKNKSERLKKIHS